MRTRDNKLRELISVTHHNFLKSNLNFASRFEVVRMLKFQITFENSNRSLSKQTINVCPRHSNT